MSPLLKLFVDKLANWEILSPFVILYGPWVDTQRKHVREAAWHSTAMFVWQDVLEIKDYSQELAKRHTIKVEQTKSTEDKVLSSEYWYENLWSREINNWLSIAPAGDLKIVLIEHLDRATIRAANALLKSFEEPLENRIIIASVLNKNTILETILSRALLMYCDETYQPPLLTTEQQELFDTITSALSKGEIGPLAKWAKSIKTWGRERAFLYNLMMYCDTHQDYIWLGLVVEAYRKLFANVLSEHVLFQLFMKYIDR